MVFGAPPQDSRFGGHQDEFTIDSSRKFDFDDELSGDGQPGESYVLSGMGGKGGGRRAGTPMFGMGEFVDREFEVESDEDLRRYQERIVRDPIIRFSSASHRVHCRNEHRRLWT